MNTAINAGPDRTTAPASTAVRNLSVQPAETFRLDNGIPVYSVNAGFQDLVRIEFLFGNRAFDLQSPLLNTASNRLLTEGTSSHSALQLAEMIDDVGAFLETEESADSCSVVLYTLNKHLERTLPVLQEVLFEAAYPESELSVFATKQKQRLVVENEKVNSLARRHFNKLLFGNNDPYGYFVQPEDYDRITREDLARYHAAHYTASNCTILVAGKIHASTFQQLNHRFGKTGWGMGSATSLPGSEFPSAGERVHYLHKEGALQSAIRIGRRMVNRTHPDYPGLAVLNTLLGGYFGSRLMSNIREDKGYTYGIGSAVVSFGRTGCFFISTEVGADVTVPALEEIYKEVERLRHESVDESELSMVRNYMLGSFLKSIDGPFSLIDRFKSIHLSGLDYSYYQRYLRTLETIGPEELRALAFKYYDRLDLLELVVGVK